MSWKYVKDGDLPSEGKFVIAKHNLGTWIHEDENVNTVVVQLRYGLSKEMRETLDSLGDSRAKRYTSADEDGNNLVPYCWETFGATKFHGQNIICWMEIPESEPEQTFGIDVRAEMMKNLNQEMKHSPIFVDFYSYIQSSNERTFYAKLIKEYGNHEVGRIYAIGKQFDNTLYSYDNRGIGQGGYVSNVIDTYFEPSNKEKYDLQNSQN